MHTVSQSGAQVLHTDASLHYLVREPAVKNDKNALLILLHGVGSHEADLFSFASRIPDNFYVVSARAPLASGTQGFAWYTVDFSTGKPVFNPEQERRSRETLVRFIDEMKSKYQTANEQTYLLGFSQGAIMSYNIAIAHPELVRGIVVMSGRLTEEIKSENISNKPLQKLHVLVLHGTSDSVLGVHYARTAVSYLKERDANVHYIEYDSGHTVTNGMLNDLVSWLKRLTH